MKTARIVGLPYLVLLVATPLYPYTNLARENVECEKDLQNRQCEPMHLFLYKRDYVIQLTDAHPHSGNRIMRNLKMMADYYNRQQRTILDFFRDSEKMGFDNAAADRKALGEMRMTPTDIEDLQGFTPVIKGKSATQNCIRAAPLLQNPSEARPKIWRDWKRFSALVEQLTDFVTKERMKQRIIA